MLRHLLFLQVLSLAIFLRIFLIFRYSIPFAYDMGRDLLWAKDISFYGIPTLIGPAASIWGVYFPPFWFYLLAIPLRISGGHPLSAVVTTAATVTLSGFLAYFLFKKEFGKFYAYILATVILFSATLINISTFAFHANLLPILTLGFIYFSYLATVKNPLFLAAAAFFVGLMFSADPAPAVIMTVVAAAIFVLFRFYKSPSLKKLISFCVIFYMVPLLPNIFFEIRNNFVQTRSLVAYFRGENPSLSGQLPLLERIVARTDLFLEFFKNSFAGENTLVASIFIALATFGIFRFFKNNKNASLLALLKINLILLAASYLVMTFIFTVEIKNWYLFGMTIPVAFLLSFSLKSLNNPRLAIVFIALYTGANIFPFFQNQKLTNSKKDPATFANQLAALDAIYQDRQGSFAVYVFTPSIYDYNWQYLFWWWGIAKNKGLPVDFAYLPNQPDYVRNKNVYAHTGLAAETAYLVIEKGTENQFYTKDQWLANFSDYNIVWEKVINQAIIIQKRTK